ncbi:sugar phosphate isomerase/epimerase family protein [Candidatus Omnitrophota bacterium]
MPDFIFSSTCFKECDLSRLLYFLAENNIDGLEISGNLMRKSHGDIVQLMNEYKDRINFYIHNYFPIPASPVVLNPAMEKTAAYTITRCKKAIDLCVEFNIPFYSMHAGMAFDPNPGDLGNSQAHFEPISLNESRDILVRSCVEIAEYAKIRGVGVLLENNVAANINCPNRLNDRYHLADPDESSKLIGLFDNSNLGMLLDVGHLKVSAQTLGFDPKIFIANFRRHIRAVHISDNNGNEDQHLLINSDMWFCDYLPWNQIRYVSLEITGQTVGKLLSQMRIVRKRIMESKNVTIVA